MPRLPTTTAQRQGGKEERKKEKWLLNWETLSWLGASELLRDSREIEKMSGGIARGRLTEERKSWRKNHPHVRTTLSHRFLPFSTATFLFSPFSLFRDLGFCCEAGDPSWWNRELDGVALHNSWKGWGVFSLLLLYVKRWLIVINRIPQILCSLLLIMKSPRFL